MNSIMVMYNSLNLEGKLSVPNFFFKSEAKNFIQNLRVVHSRQQATLQKIGLYTERDKLVFSAKINQEEDGTFTAVIELQEAKPGRFDHIKSFTIIKADGTEEVVKLRD